jgi:phospholipid/cholesterol/gamma-HCH transport system ATP-binding protein
MTTSANAGAARDPARPRILIENVHKGFSGKPVLRGVHLEILPGEALVILGASGGGKSVLLKHMIGLLQPDKGRVVIDGRDMTHAGNQDWTETRRLFGMSFQEGALFDSMNVYQNIAFPLRRRTKLKEPEIKTRVAECLEMVQLAGIDRKMPSELSGGMRRRVGFARAIAIKPEILLFDEPNTGLDPITSAEIDRDILKMRSEMPLTSVTITHDTQSAFRIATRIALLREGRIAAIATPDEFRRLPDVYIQKFLAGEPLDGEDA